MPSQAHRFEPLLPTLPQPALDALAEEVCRRGFELKRLVHPVTEARIAKLLRSVNSYYSNRIEGQQTHPKDIERALRKSFSKEPGKARLQRLAVAHIETQIEMERRLAEDLDLAVFSTQFLAGLHHSFYGRLPREDRVTEEGDEVAPGYFRRHDVTVGGHAAPDWQSVPAFLQRIEEIYSAVRGLSARLIAIACAHHRLAWVHPFRDGNGRVGRLQSQAALLQHGAGSALWSVSRGLARDVQASTERAVCRKQVWSRSRSIFWKPVSTRSRSWRRCSTSLRCAPAWKGIFTTSRDRIGRYGSRQRPHCTTCFSLGACHAGSSSR
jgi:Fic family protein